MFRSKLCKSVIAVVILLQVNSVLGQELNARVSVNTSQVGSSVDKKVFQTLQTAIVNFLNKRKWTSDDFATQEKINCSFVLNLQPGSESNVYKAALTIQAARPVYNSTYQTSLMNFLDPDVTFRYVEYQPLEFNENRVQGSEPLSANLTAVLAYYVNIILGLDYDSFSPKGGDPYFQKANTIVNSAPDGRGISGWKPFDGQRNRYWLAENLVNTRYAAFHDAFYSFYRKGMDNLADNEIKGRQEVIKSFGILSPLHESNPGIMILPFFFQGKSDEIIKMLKKSNPSERAKAVELLQKMDITNSGKYRQELK
ncbi:MAG: DUF4835 family protein [Chitinophagaceae bacterium]